MAPKGSFENNFANYSEEAASHILNKTKDGNAIPYLDLENLKGRKISFLCGDAGPLALATVISYRLGSRKNELPDYKSLVQRLMALSSLLNDSPDEVLYGKSGYLFALLFVNKHIPGKEVIPSNHIEKAQPYISMIELRSFIKPTLEWLINHKFPSGNFPSSLGSGSGDRLVQWCHGAPGFVPLCLLAHKVFDDDNYLRIALQCGEVIWERGLSTKGYSICHGVSGNAYAFIQLYQATKKPVHLYRACCFMEWCALERPGTELHAPDRPASLYEGLTGRLYLAEDLLRVSEAKFPAFTL
ncbi:hypothetical protein MSG28_003459 [Choristoneura fumiferana]|uniref:Uncharacterized protein n=2 Tax=Choristoneura fumiferana TaxID=7141 RepID=A0ACC0KEY0_CHOFU|nr:hypothetical protein MSG28_003456 [Choristoneura fumiferana]KAI8435027.1 hypothetical protein MSG28_003459 [Choristoneura fumiferana]